MNARRQLLFLKHMAAQAASTRKNAPLPGLAPNSRLLGIDPGTRVAGWGVIACRGPRLELTECGILKAPAKWAPAERLRLIFEGLEEVIARHRPVAAALEETFAGENPKSAIAMGQGRGIALLALARAGLQVYELSPAEIKKAVTGSGAASKAIVARMVAVRLALQTPPTPEDATDALAAAIALANRIPLDLLRSL